MKGISFSVPGWELELIEKILDRCEASHITREDERIDHMMDLCACIANGTPLDLERMLTWHSDLDVSHDIWGINKHINHLTGYLENCFLPRFYKPAEKEVEQ